jgi:hypothetical protein
MVLAAAADRAAAPLAGRPGSVLALYAALAGLPQPVEPDPDVPHLEPVKALTANARRAAGVKKIA